MFGEEYMNQNLLDQAKTAALARFTDTGPDRLNCAQTMTHFALAVLEGDETLVTAARYLGGGVSGMGGTCGVITGTAMALGLRDRELGLDDVDSIETAHAALKDLMRDFETQFGSCACRELTGFDVSTPEGSAAFKASEAHERCPLYVTWMCDRLYPLLSEND